MPRARSRCPTALRGHRLGAHGVTADRSWTSCSPAAGAQGPPVSSRLSMADANSTPVSRDSFRTPPATRWPAIQSPGRRLGEFAVGLPPDGRGEQVIWLAGMRGSQEVRKPRRRVCRKGSEVQNVTPAKAFGETLGSAGQGIGDGADLKAAQARGTEDDAAVGLLAGNGFL